MQPKKTYNSKKKRQNDDDALASVLKNYKSHKDYVESAYWKQWEDNWRVYNGQRVKVSYEGVADLTDPIIYSNIQAMVSNVTGGKPKVNYTPNKYGQETNTQVLNSVFDYFWECSGMSLLMIPWVKDIYIYGTGVLHTYWDMQKPRISYIPLRDFIVDPTATHPGLDTDAKFMGRRFFTTRDALKEFEYIDPETKEPVSIYKNLDKIPEMDSGTDMSDSDKENKDMFLGSTLGEDAKKDQIEVIELTYKDKIIAVANRNTLIRNDDNEYGFINFIVQRNDIDGSLFYGKSEVEVNIDQQEYLNDLINQSLDNVSYSLNNMWTLDPAYADYADQVESAPGAVYPFPEGALRPIEKPLTTTAAYQERSAIKESIRETSGIDEVIKGVQKRGNADVTATEIQQQVASAGKRFSYKLMMLEQEGLKQMALMWFKMIQKFMTKEQMVRMVGPNGVEWVPFNAKDYEGEYEPKVQLDSTVKDQELEESKKYQALYTVFMGDPAIDQIELKKLILEKAFNLDNSEAAALLNPSPQGSMDPNAVSQDPTQMGAPPAGPDTSQLPSMGMPPGPGMPTSTPAGQPKESISLGDMYKTALAAGKDDIAMQIEALVGLVPSQTPSKANVETNVKMADSAHAQTMDKVKHSQGVVDAQAQKEATDLPFGNQYVQ